MHWLLRLLRRCEVCLWRRRRYYAGRTGVYLCVRCHAIASYLTGLDDQQLRRLSQRVG